jgi:hypothetical protein
MKSYGKFFTNEHVSKLYKYALKLCSTFASTYICECIFSTKKTKHGNKLSEDV